MCHYFLIFWSGYFQALFAKVSDKNDYMQCEVFSLLSCAQSIRHYNMYA